ncbi:MAG: glycoside hydrolase family 3 protein [Lachnospiraceae bacterium]|nr:glycoside hydrolase family 3 protein [Lachnospiraceae bacterium]
MKAKKTVGIVLIALLLALCVVIDAAGVRFSTVITRFWSGTFGTVKTESNDTQLKATDAAAELTETIAEEGIVLLKNNGLLPMAPTKDNRSIALLGYASYSPMYIGAGSVSQAGAYLSNDFIDFYDAFETAGYSVNKDMKAYYAKYGNSNGASGDMSGSGWSQATGVDDGPLYGDSEASVAYREALEKAKAEARTAVLVFSRVGAEGGDCALDMTGAANGDAGKHYLQFQQTEIDLIDYAMENFENVIVVINSSNAMELGELDADGVDAVLWIGGPGSTGIQALADIVSGDVNPSGKLPDTFAYDLKTAPSYWSATCGKYANYDEFGESTYTYKNYTYTFNNKVDGGVTYDVEGIYIGYRFYETADAEGYLKFEEAVQYPFGFGLSYTSFDWEVTSQKFGETHGEIEIQVKVTNVGSVPGKDVVELYYTAPYYKDRNIEKSAKVLGAFAKTKTLKPGESDTLTLTMPVDNLSSYDYLGERCYVADEGTYAFNLQTDSHHIKVNSDGKTLATLNYEVAERRIYKESGVGARSTDLVAAENAFDYSSVGDGNIGTTIPYVSRADFAGTHPSVTMGKRLDQYDDLKMGADMIKYITEQSLGGSDVVLENDDKYVSKSLIPVATEQDNGLTMDDVAGYTEWDDEIWDKLINQMTVNELALLAEDCGYGTPAIESIGKTLATDIDGPAGISSANLNYYGNEYTSEPLMAATWNVDLLRQIGESVGREAAVAGVNGWYAPGANTHRTPFNGRCGEYFSEDPLLAGKCAAAEVGGAQSKGLYVYLKHFVCNDNDKNRGGMYTWINEQELREIQLGAFEYAVKEEDCTGLMMAYNRIGPCECSVNYSLNTTVIQNEWGYRGASVTDGYSAAIGCDKYEHPDLQLRAGSGLLLYTGGFGGTGGFSENTTNTEAGIAMMHDLAKKVVYRHANSNAMSISRDYSPTWIYLFAAINVVLLLLALLIYNTMVKEKKNKGKDGAAAALSLLLVVCLAGGSFTACGNAGKTSTAELPDVVTDLVFDFESGDFSFSDVANAKNYNVRVFDANPAEGDAQMPLAARRVRDREGYEKYEGFVDLSELQPGNAYSVYVYTYAKDSNGDLINSVSEPVTGVYKTTYATVDGTGIKPTFDEEGVTVSFGNDFFTAANMDKAPTYRVKLYADGAEIASADLTSDQVETTTREEEGSSGQISTVTENSSSLHFDKVGDSVTIQLISTDDTAYYDSEESAPITVTEYVEEVPAAEGKEGGEAGSGEGENGEGGEAGSGEGENGEGGEAGSDKPAE